MSPPSNDMDAEAARQQKLVNRLLTEATMSSTPLKVFVPGRFRGPRARAGEVRR